MIFTTVHRCSLSIQFYYVCPMIEQAQGSHDALIRHILKGTSNCVVTVHLQGKHYPEVRDWFMYKLCCSCLPFKLFPVCASWYDRAADSCNNSFGVFHPVLPMVCIFHSPGTFANKPNHKYSIGATTWGFVQKYPVLIFLQLHKHYSISTCSPR